MSKYHTNYKGTATDIFGHAKRTRNKSRFELYSIIRHEKIGCSRLKLTSYSNMQQWDTGIHTVYPGVQWVVGPISAHIMNVLLFLPIIRTAMGKSVSHNTIRISGTYAIFILLPRFSTYCVATRAQGSIVCRMNYKALFIVEGVAVFVQRAYTWQPNWK